MAPPKVKKPKNGTPPPIDKLIIPAIGIGLALLAYQFIKGMTADLVRVNVHDELELRDVLFGEGDSGRSYAVLCQDEASTAPISSVFSDAFKEGSSRAHFRLLDCQYVLPASGKSIADRFKLDTSVRPTVFVSGKGVEAPTQIPAKHLKTGAMLVKALKMKLEPHAAKIETTQDLKVKCLNQPICGLLLKGSKKAPAYLKDAMSKLLEEFPKVTFASIDSSVLYVKNLEEYLPELQGEEPRFVVLEKLSGSLDKDGKRLITSYATLDENTSVSYGTMSNLVASVVRRTKATEKIPSLPSVKTRTKKLVEEERQKRQRRKEQQTRQKEKASNAGTSSTENDGTREGRRAERDRRREEHRRKNNVKEKTPEELAEMERQRRKRMEDEASKWNVAPDDAPDAGMPFEEEDEYEVVYEDEHEDHGEDDEVIDLD
ncbi:hypothetical protein FisN_15Hh160 [Fistulifera solaris]|uniref:Uncharacterized protein n=1 Tax=Fistulifera solaris TaxID=1519565 RepID=A0A1Z5JFA1_FISSO|nr:hypothetical protein FisN_15Hh160 [Fistulifera solaris]|eukprot:GAX12684.1 hypothetical protein FisN_15Hh160 [Fistulifera solaris]